MARDYDDKGNLIEIDTTSEKPSRKERIEEAKNKKSFWKTAFMSVVAIVMVIGFTGLTNLGKTKTTEEAFPEEIKQCAHGCAFMQRNVFDDEMLMADENGTMSAIYEYCLSNCITYYKDGEIEGVIVQEQ